MKAVRLIYVDIERGSIIYNTIMTIDSQLFLLIGLCHNSTGALVLVVV